MTTMTEEQKQIQTVAEPDDDRIDLVAIGKTLWAGRKTLIISIFSGTVLGVFVAILSPKEYTATTVMVPQESSDMSKSNLSNLASLAGLDLGMAQSVDISPLVYPKIVNSIPFRLELMNAPLNFSDYDQPISLFDYYTKYGKKSVLGAVKKYTLGLPGVIIGAIKGKPKALALPKHIRNQPIHLTDDQSMVNAALDAIITLDVNKKEGTLTLTANMPEALAAAQLAQKAQDLLQQFITEYKIKKAKADLDFIQGRYNIAKAEAERYQVGVAVNTDRFKNLTSSLPQIGTARMQTQYTIASSLFQDLAKQLEQAKIQVKKETPVFTIVEPVSIPSKKTKPNRPMILFIWIFLGGVVGVGTIYGKKQLQEIKLKWNE